MAASETRGMSKLDEFASAMGLIRGTGSSDPSSLTRAPEYLRDRNTVSVFVRHLWEMVSDGVIVHWHHTGLAIVVNVRVYETNVRRLYSKHNRTNKFSLFYRQLTCHGFIRLTRDHLDDCLASDPRLAVFFHSCFRRDKPEILWKIRSVRRMETGERVNTQDTCLIRRGRQTGGFVPLTNILRRDAGGPGNGEAEPGIGEVATGVSVPQIAEDDLSRRRVKSTNQPSTRGQQTFSDFINQPFGCSRTPPVARPTRKRRRPQSTSTHRPGCPPSRAVPVSRLPEIIFVPHLVTVNGLFPLEPCYDFWKHGSFQTAMAAERTQGPHTMHRHTYGDGNFVDRHQPFISCQRVLATPEDRTLTTAKFHMNADVTGGETDHEIGAEDASFGNGDNTNICSKELQVWNSASKDDSGVTPGFDLRPPDGSVSEQISNNVDEPKCIAVDDGNKKRCDHVAKSVIFSDMCYTCDSVSPPIKVWHRPPPGMDPLVILDKLML